MKGIDYTPIIDLFIKGEGTSSSPYKLTKNGILVVFLGGIGLTISLIYLFVRNIFSIFHIYI